MRKLFIVGGVFCLAAGCADDAPVAEVPGIQILVSPGVIDCDGSACGSEFDFVLALATVGPSGDITYQADELSFGRFGVDNELAWVGGCTAGENDLLLTFRDFVPGTASLPADLVGTGSMSLPFTCSANAAVRIDYDVELATLHQDPGLATLAFSDVTCTIAHRCEADVVAADVTCTRPNTDGLGLALGLSQVNIDCGFLSQVVPVDGSSSLPTMGIDDVTTGFVGGLATQRWSVAATPTDLQTCTLSVSLVAAPELIGGRSPDCTGWPVLNLELPLATDACAAATLATVSWDDPGPASVVVDARGPHTPPPSPVVSCASAPVGGGESESTQGYFDLSVAVHAPAD